MLWRPRSRLAIQNQTKSESPKSEQTVVTGAESTDINLFKDSRKQSITMHRLSIYKLLLTHDQFTWILRCALSR